MTASHKKSCGCRLCDDARSRTINTDEWLTRHLACGDIASEKVNHPFIDTLRLKCSCGASHITFGKSFVHLKGKVGP